MNYTVTRGAQSHLIMDGGELVAEMTYSNAGEGAMIIDSTYVRDENRGEGLGSVLLDSLVAQARAEGRRVVPLCPFVKAQFERHVKYRDIAAT